MVDKSLTCPHNGSGTLIHNASKVLRFLDANNKQVLAHRIRFRTTEHTAGTSATGRIHYRVLADAANTVATDATHMFVEVGEIAISIENQPMSQIRFFNDDSTVDVDLYWEAVSDTDITGTTLT
jgi:hypothetical protein